MVLAEIPDSTEKEQSMRRMMMVLSVAALMVALTASAAFAAVINCPNGSDGTCFGTAVGDGMYGTPGVDTIYGFGGADLMRGYGSADTLYGGNESGWGDKILGGAAKDRVLGQGGDDGLFGQNGNDQVNGGYGNDIVVGGPGRDILSGGPGSDEVNAQDGQRDTILICGSERDRIYYDRGLDVLKGCLVAQGTASLSASEVSEGGKVKLSTKQPPERLVEHTGKVLVKHEGEERCVADKELKDHLKHGDEIVNATGCSGAEYED